MNAIIDTVPAQYWPVIMGWILVLCMFLFSWKRQALIATMGMSIVTLVVIGASRYTL